MRRADWLLTWSLLLVGGAAQAATPPAHVAAARGRSPAAVPPPDNATAPPTAVFEAPPPGSNVDAASAVPVAPSEVASATARAAATAAAPAVASSAPTAPIDAQRASEPLAPPAHRDPRQIKLLGRLVDLSLHVGVAVPGGPLFQNVDSGALYGAGIGKELALHPNFAIRGELSYGYTRLVNKRRFRSGHVGIQMATLRLDLLFGHAQLRPFVGGGVGLYPWVGRIHNRVDDLDRARSTSDFGGQVVAGVDWRLGKSFALAPELSWRRLTGSFSDMLWGAELAARWRL